MAQTVLDLVDRRVFRVQAVAWMTTVAMMIGASACIIPAPFETRDEVILPLVVDSERASPPNLEVVELDMSPQSVQDFSFYVRADSRSTLRVRWFLDYDQGLINPVHQRTSPGMPVPEDDESQPVATDRLLDFRGYQPCIQPGIDPDSDIHLLTAVVTDREFDDTKGNPRMTAAGAQSATVMWVIRCRPQ